MTPLYGHFYRPVNSTSIVWIYKVSGSSVRIVGVNTELDMWIDVFTLEANYRIYNP